MARLIFLATVTGLTLLQALELIPPGVIAQGPNDAAPMLVIMLVTVAAVALLYRLALRGRRLDKLGLGAVVVDVTVLALVPLDAKQLFSFSMKLILRYFVLELQFQPITPDPPRLSAQALVQPALKSWPQSDDQTPVSG